MLSIKMSISTLDARDHPKVTILIYVAIFLAKSGLFFPKYFPMKKVADYMRPTGIMYVNKPIFLRIV